MDDCRIFLRLFESFDDSKKERIKDHFEETLFNKFLNWDLSDIDDNERDELKRLFLEIIYDSDYDEILEDPWVDEEVGGVYYQVRIGLSIKKLDIHIIYYFEGGHSIDEFNSFEEMENNWFG